MKKHWFLNLLFVIFIMVTFMNGNLTFANQDDSAKKYIKMLESPSQKQRIDAAKMITRSGLSDPGLFNMIDKKLLKEYNLNSSNIDHVDEMSWMCKALASSGSSTYKPTLEKIAQTASNQKLKRYARQSLNLVDEYAEKNKIMKNSNNSDPSLSPKLNEYINMLRSNKLSLKKDAAKSIYRENYTQEKLFDVVNEELFQGFKDTSANDRNHTDTMAWLCKALGSSGNPKYKQTLIQIIEQTTNPTLKMHAQKSLNMLQ